MRYIRGKSDLQQKLNFKLELGSPAERFTYTTAVCHLRADFFDLSRAGNSWSSVSLLLWVTALRQTISLVSRVCSNAWDRCLPVPKGRRNMLKRWCISSCCEGVVFIRLKSGFLVLIPFHSVWGSFSVCYPARGLLFAEGFFACKENSAITSEVKTALWKNSGFVTELWISPGESVINKVTRYPCISSDEMSEFSWTAFSKCPL